MRIWTSWLCFQANVFWQCTQVYGLSLLWTLRWLFSVDFWEKHLSHTGHWYGFSPVWTLQADILRVTNLSWIKFLTSLCKYYDSWVCWCCPWIKKYNKIFLTHWHIFIHWYTSTYICRTNYMFWHLILSYLILSSWKNDMSVSNRTTGRRSPPTWHELCSCVSR